MVPVTFSDFPLFAIYRCLTCILTWPDPALLSELGLHLGHNLTHDPSQHITLLTSQKLTLTPAEINFPSFPGPKHSYVGSVPL